MEILVKVIAKGGVENVQVQDKALQKIDVTLAWGENQMVATAFDKQALVVAGLPVDDTSLFVADVTFSLSKGEKKFQNVRLNRLTAF